MVTHLPWSNIFVAAVGAALSPVPIVAVILILFSPKSKRNGALFVLGWIVGVVTMVWLVLWLMLRVLAAGRIASGQTATSMTGEASLVLGAIFLVIAVVQWRRRPAAGAEQPLPAWSRMLDHMAAWQAPLLAFGLAVINPKNFALTLAVALAIGDAEVMLRQAWLGMLVYIVLGSLTITVPVLYRILAGERASRRLTLWKSWLLQNNATVVCLVLLLIGVGLIGKGLEAMI